MNGPKQEKKNNDYEEDIEEYYTHTYTSQYVPSGALEPIAEAMFHLFHLQSLGIDIEVRFCHNRIISLSL